MSLSCFTYEIIYFSYFNLNTLIHPSVSDFTRIFLFAHGLSLKSSQKIASFLRPTPL